MTCDSSPHYRSDTPQRYSENYARYIMRGGLIRLEDDIKGFTAGRQNEGDMGRFYFFCLAFDQMMKEGVKGDVAELGVFRGHTATLIARMARRMGTTAYLLDTFEGFDAKDLRGVDAEHQMEFANTSLEVVRKLVGNDHVQFIKGHFPVSSSQIPDNVSFCLVHLDCDLYAPISSALKFFYPRLLPGGYLIIHDYASLCWDGAERAVDEFFSARSESVIPLMDGCGSAVIRKSKSEDVCSNWLVQKKLSRFGADWVTAGGGGLTELLVDGWSGIEPDRVWGIGATHTLQIIMSALPDSDVRVEAEVEAALVSSRPSQIIDVFSSGEQLVSWKFSINDNRAIRRIVFPATCITRDDFGYPSIKLEFRPHSVVSMSELDPRIKDSRKLGLGLFRIRRGQLVDRN